ncbi:MAG TPA: homoserine kinase [Woeseiaceae bacterium]|nr:homoserine kinase [Woeseiaceae bacterium]
MAERAVSFAPASIGNVAVGFDLLGLAIEGVGDRVEARRTATPGITIDAVRAADGSPLPDLSADPARNTASIAAQRLWDRHGGAGGAALTVVKGVPLQSGMGSSAASAVAAVVAVNALFDRPLRHEALLGYALEGERFASGGGLHADNVAPSLLGGLILCPPVFLPDVVRLPSPAGIRAVVLHPELRVDTAEARRGLRQDYRLHEWVEQQGYLAAFVAACAADDIDLLGRALRDVLIEPQRVGAVPCFEAVRDAALLQGALGASLSGSGPSIFALAERDRAAPVAAAMAAACRAAGIDCQTWISTMTAPGARIESVDAKS